MNIPHVDIKDVHPIRFHLPITDINLCAHFTPQGSCDENGDLAVKQIPRQRNQTTPPRANHFSFWLGFGGTDVVMFDVTQDCPSYDPYASDVAESRHIPAVVRLASKAIPTDDDIGCVLRELNIRKHTTLNDIIQVILAKCHHQYKFRPVHKQQAGCRHWIYTIAQDLEEAGIVGVGYTDDVLSCLKTYYNRYPYQTVSRRWERGGNWGPRSEFICADLRAGSFYD